MSESLEQLLEDGVIDEVLGRLKSGKEADVWLVRHRDEVLAAKVYKDRAQRSFKNNAGYKEGRAVRNTRTQRAMDRGSKFGQAAAEDAWKSAESDALHKLHKDGVRVPEPVLFYEGILLMRLVLDPDGNPAPRLIDVALTPEDAALGYADLRAQAVRMLCCELIHGDLSPYNVLLGAEGPTIIDLPQVISAAHNSTAEMYFKRDIENLRSFFIGFEPALASRAGDAAEIWQAYVRRELSPDFVPSGRPPPPPREPTRKPPRAPPTQQQPRQQAKPTQQHPRANAQSTQQHPRANAQPTQQHPRPHAPPTQQHPRANAQPAQPRSRPPRPGQPQGSRPPAPIVERGHTLRPHPRRGPPR